MFCRLFQSLIMYLLAFLSLFTGRNDRFLSPVIYFNQKSPYLFIYLKPEKGIPFEQNVPSIGHYREYSRLLLLATLCQIY